MEVQTIPKNNDTYINKDLRRSTNCGTYTVNSKETAEIVLFMIIVFPPLRPSLRVLERERTPGALYPAPYHGRRYLYENVQLRLHWPTLSSTTGALGSWPANAQPARPLFYYW